MPFLSAVLHGFSLLGRWEVLVVLFALLVVNFLFLPLSGPFLPWIFRDIESADPSRVQRGIATRMWLSATFRTFTIAIAVVYLLPMLLGEGHALEPRYFLIGIWHAFVCWLVVSIVFSVVSAIPLLKVIACPNFGGAEFLQAVLIFNLLADSDMFLINVGLQPPQPDWYLHTGWMTVLFLLISCAVTGLVFSVPLVLIRLSQVIPRMKWLRSALSLLGAIGSATSVMGSSAVGALMALLMFCSYPAAAKFQEVAPSFDVPKITGTWQDENKNFLLNVTEQDGTKIYGRLIQQNCTHNFSGRFSNKWGAFLCRDRESKPCSHGIDGYIIQFDAKHRLSVSELESVPGGTRAEIIYVAKELQENKT